MKTLKDTDESTVVHYIRQACAALTVEEVLGGVDKDWIYTELIQRQVIGRLLFALANVKYAESQRNASMALYALTQRLPDQRDVIVEALGPLADEWSRKPGLLQDHIDPVNATAIKHNSLKMM